MLLFYLSLLSRKKNDINFFVGGFPNPDSISKTRMEKLGNEMIEYCGGLPLATTIFGGLLATKQTQEDWENVLRFVKSHKENFGVNKVFALSFNDLPLIVFRPLKNTIGLT